MRKIWLIIKREYLSRVRNKTFILSTFLTPLFFAGIIALAVFISSDAPERERIAVVGNTGAFPNKPDSSGRIIFIPDASADTADLDSKGYSAILYSPHTGDNDGGAWKMYSRKPLDAGAGREINSRIRSDIEKDLMVRNGLDISLVDSIQNIARMIEMETIVLQKKENARGPDTGIAFGIGYAAGFIIYIALMIYGSMVMRGVMEEKTNRIAEIMVSSVKPFQLMMGKILGIGAVGLTQFLLWAVLLLGFSMIFSLFIPAELMQQAAAAGTPMPQTADSFSKAAVNLTQTQKELMSVNWQLIIPGFIFYFLFGYLFYAAIFAAVGSAVNDDSHDVQSLMFPVTAPIVLAIIIMITAISYPEGPLAVWGSIIPFFSPVVMMARIPFGVPGMVPWQQLATSMFLLVAGFLFTTWLSARIYRTGILLYGKKITWKEMWRWAFEGK